MKLFSPHKARQGGERAGVERRKENIFTSNRIELLENSIWDFLCMSREEKRHLLELFFIQRHESFMTVIFDAFFTAAENDFLGCVSFRLAYVGMNARQKGVVRLFSFSPFFASPFFFGGGNAQSESIKNLSTVNICVLKVMNSRCLASGFRSLIKRRLSCRRKIASDTLEKDSRPHCCEQLFTRY